ncbi:Mor transcription activator family protein [Curvibacter gracilis]|uniref:Mor transcription activator family protein n=1 Tax=Curvibacter gracilis TaxID=230310 RepID=UPI001FE097AC|nr:Mor transcription activator family protein [Curvibacter gracilis]
MTPLQQRPEMPVHTEADLVDRILSYLEARLPQEVQALGKLNQLENELRNEFAGTLNYIPTVAKSERERRVLEVKRLFNGRNVAEVAEVLKISRSTVYRIVKQPDF